MKHDYTIRMNEIVYRPLHEEDIEMVRVWRNTDSIRTSFIYQGIISAPDQQKWYKGYLENDTDIMFIIEYAGKPVGTVALYHIDRDKKEAEFGRLMIGDLSARGLKLGQKATKSISAFGLYELNLERVLLEVFADNDYAKKAYEEVGFKAISSKVLQEREIIIMEIRKGGQE